jgi:ATP/maltotriose-dependent transcriptional regulator MalT
MRVRLQQAQGDTAAVFESLRQAEALARGRGVAPATAFRIEAMHVRLWLAQANLEAATRWVCEQALDSGDEISYQHQFAYMTP